MYRHAGMEYRAEHSRDTEDALAGYLDEAARIVAEAVASYATLQLEADPILPPQAERLRWFPLPSEVLAELRGQESVPVLAPQPIHV